MIYDIDYYKDEIHCLYDENKNLKEDFKRHIDRINELTNRIDKAIKYIEWNLEANEEVIEYMNYDGNFKKVLDILKGE